MLKNLFLAPGRLLARLFSREKKKTYRSTRQRPKNGLGMVILSIIGWLAVAAALLYAADKAGLLNKALDVGVEVAINAEADNRAGGETADPPAPEAERGPGSVSGSLSGSGQSGGAPASGSATLPEGSSIQSAQVVDPELWLVILHTIPKSSRSEAERRKNQYRERGLEVQILDTDSFPRLRAGSWIIALGPFDEKAAALAASDKAKTFNSGLMIRRGL